MAKVELKKPIVDEISELLKDAKSAVLVDYRGLTDADVLKLIDGTYDKYDLDNMILDLSI